jgi:hypothetical protein
VSDAVGGLGRLVVDRFVARSLLEHGGWFAPWVGIPVTGGLDGASAGANQ